MKQLELGQLPHEAYTQHGTIWSEALPIFKIVRISVQNIVQHVSSGRRLHPALVVRDGFFVLENTSSTPIATLRSDALIEVSTFGMDVRRASSLWL
jgi:hypothetical protein